MKERDLKIKKLLQLMLDNQDLFTSGLCNWVTNLRMKNIICENEYNIILDYINKNAPFLHRLNIFKTEPFYWKEGDIAPRIKWLKKHIAKL
jgi:hypothetical protein